MVTSFTGPYFGNTAINNTTLGDVAWTNVTFAQGPPDASGASVSNTDVGFWVDSSVKLIKNNAIVGADLSYNTIVGGGGGFAWTSYGASSNLWGTAWLASDINNSNFGVGMAVTTGGSGAGSSSNYIALTTFNFAIPSSSIINGIIAEFDANITSAIVCFVEDTIIHTINGNQKIQDLKEKDLVLTFDLAGNISYQPLLKIKRGKSSEGIISINNEVFTTIHHPFYVGFGIWVEAKDLEIGNTVFFLINDKLVPRKIEFLQHHKITVDVYGLETDLNHTYFANNYAVHNNSTGSTQYNLFIDSVRITVFYQVPIFMGLIYNGNTLYARNSTSDYSLNTNLSTGAWINLCLVTSGLGATLYVNGAFSFFSTQAKATYVSGIGSFGFGGAGVNTTGEQINGYLGPVGVYNTALSSAQVMQNFNALKGRYGL